MLVAIRESYLHGRVPSLGRGTGRRYHTDMTYFFTYGDRMSSERMGQFAPDATLVGAARLTGYRLAFNVASRAWGGGAANAVPDPRGSMWGVLWDISDDDTAGLDSFRGDDEIAHGVVEVTVQGPDGSLPAKTLVVATDGGFIRPNERYVAMLRANAERQGLPEEALLAIDEAAAGPSGRAASI